MGTLRVLCALAVTAYARKSVFCDFFVLQFIKFDHQKLYAHLIVTFRVGSIRLVDL